MDREHVLSILRTHSRPENILLQYCIDCGKDVDLSVKFINLAAIAERVPLLIEILCGIYEINMLQDSEGEIIQYF